MNTTKDKFIGFWGGYGWPEWTTAKQREAWKMCFSSSGPNIWVGYTILKLEAEKYSANPKN